MNQRLLKAIVKNGDLYCTRYLSKYDKHELLTNWWKAFDFFLAHACFQGRRDYIPQRVYESACQALKPYFSNGQNADAYETQMGENWQGIKAQLKEKIGKGKVGKGRDIEMVTSALSFIGKIHEKNIVAYSVQRIKDRKIQDHYNELQGGKSSTGIVQVGSKIAAFYLRDVVSVFDLTEFIDNTSAFCLQAVDTWVQKVAEKFGIVEENADPSAVQQAIVSMCERNHISALRFNQGAWFTGYHAFDLLLDLLSKE
jgi:hypothetical protein